MNTNGVYKYIGMSLGIHTLIPIEDAFATYFQKENDEKKWTLTKPW